MELIYKEVRFDEWCSKCRYEKKKDTDDPCNRCLAEPVNQNSKKPVEWKEKPNV